MVFFFVCFFFLTLRKITIQPVYISNTDVAQTPHFGTVHILESNAGNYARDEADEEGEKEQEATVKTQCDVEKNKTTTP